MKRIFFLATLALCAFASAQGGFGGGGFGGMGGAQGAQQGRDQRRNDRVAEIEQRIGTYLNGDEIKNILTPGEFSEWKLTLKAGQVVIAEARSDAFDPALEMVVDDKTVLASNDDRYPGDQRPLLLWRCTKDGEYSLRARCFQNKSGGQVFVRFSTYDSVDIGSADTLEAKVSTKNPFLIRVPLKAGELRTINDARDNTRDFGGFSTSSVIAPGGLPDIELSREITPILNVIMAPVAGEYYVMAQAYSQTSEAKIKLRSTRIEAKEISRENARASVQGAAGTPNLWKVDVKAGELTEVNASGPSFVIAEIPDISKYNLDKPENNPFFPQPADVKKEEKGPAITLLPARARDSRVAVFAANRDATLWIACAPNDRRESPVTVSLSPAAQVFESNKVNQGKLRIGRYDYWAFDAQAGDVLTFASKAEDFSQRVIVRAPDLGEIRNGATLPDQATTNWQMTVQRPGRFLVSVSCVGDGGGGDYTLTRKVLPAKTFSKDTPAQGEISQGEIQIWKFKAMPNDPLLVHWRLSAGAAYDVAVYNESGTPTDFQRDYIDEKNRYGILSVREPATYVIVLTGTGAKSSYSIDLKTLPDLK